MLGPVRDDPQAAQRPGFTKEDFHIDWDTRTLTCPNGITSPPWKPTLGDGHPRLSVLFPRKACRECDDRLKCTGNVDGKGRHIFLLPEPQQKIQTQARRDQKTSDWQRRYAIRAGCEATVSETVPLTACAITAAWRRRTSNTYSQPPEPTSSASANASRPALPRHLRHDHPPTFNGSPKADGLEITNSILSVPGPRRVTTTVIMNGRG